MRRMNRVFRGWDHAEASAMAEQMAMPPAPAPPTPSPPTPPPALVDVPLAVQANGKTSTARSAATDNTSRKTTGKKARKSKKTAKTAQAEGQAPDKPKAKRSKAAVQVGSDAVGATYAAPMPAAAAAPPAQPSDTVFVGQPKPSKKARSKTGGASSAKRQAGAKEKPARPKKPRLPKVLPQVSSNAGHSHQLPSLSVPSAAMTSAAAFMSAPPFSCSWPGITWAATAAGMTPAVSMMPWAGNGAAYGTLAPVPKAAVQPGSTLRLPGTETPSPSLANSLGNVADQHYQAGTANSLQSHAAATNSGPAAVSSSPAAAVTASVLQETLPATIPPLLSSAVHATNTTALTSVPVPGAILAQASNSSTSAERMRPQAPPANLPQAVATPSQMWPPSTAAQHAGVIPNGMHSLAGANTIMPSASFVPLGFYPGLVPAAPYNTLNFVPSSQPVPNTVPMATSSQARSC